MEQFSLLFMKNISMIWVSILAQMKSCFFKTVFNLILLVRKLIHINQAMKWYWCADITVTEVLSVFFKNIKVKKIEKYALDSEDISGEELRWNGRVGLSTC